ncbi:hypothetical protein [Natronocalculus amylovorans]|uniref:Pectate lyase n=1 Tax=Natronocalculus amylovorans TaxID=2917812 RepID=A0AAE3G0R2_9EURY|nr:hypothetical protein [Natronocalculus amylovorans]MCL9818285.1 hypothetical protein [Natronocalculus amylovorans]
MKFNTQKGGVWSQGTPKIRKGDQWISIGGTTTDSGTVSGSGMGYSWDQTHTDTSWLSEADSSNDITVETVTNLEPSGPGSLEEALENAEDNDTTIVAFEVGGVIDHGPISSNWMRSYADNVYVAGQTAPYPGITLIRGGVRVHGDNSIFHHMSFLPGDDVSDPNSQRAFTFDEDGNNNLVDHCTFAWAPDTNLRFRKDHSNHSAINCIISEALNMSSHDEAPHGYSIHMSENISELAIMGNLVSHGWKRNPVCNHDGVEFCFINNYVYNWGDRHYHGTSSSPGPYIDWIGNVSEHGVNTDKSIGTFDHRAATVYYNDQLLIPSDQSLSDSNLNYVNEPQNLPPGLEVDDIVSSTDLKDFLSPQIGPRPANRDPVSDRIITEWVNGEGQIIDNENDVGGYPNYNLTSRSLNPPSTNVLDWLQRYTDEVELGAVNPLH